MSLFSAAMARVVSWRAFTSTSSALVLAVAFALFAVPAQAQQTGDIAGQVTDASGNGVSGVTIEASSNILPQARTTTTADNGRYRLRLLPPGSYDLEFRFPDGSSQTRSVFVALQQTAEANIVTGEGIEEIVVTAEQLAHEVGQGSLADSISANTIDSVPTGQEYRDLMKLIPGVMYTEFSVRGPSAGGSGQDNTYQFDGVDVSLPLFGVLSSEPSSHDIAQVSIVRGGAKAIGFNRSGGFLMNTVSKRGTNEFSAELSYQVQSAGMTGDQDVGSNLAYDEDRTWINASVGGPIVSDRLFFYASYYAPERKRNNSSNLYGPVGDYESTRDEYFGKLTFAPTDDILLDLSYRTSDREVINRSIGANEAATVSVGDSATHDQLIMEGSWIISDNSSINFKYTDFENLNATRPDNLFGFTPQQGSGLDVNNLDQMGYVDLPLFRDENDPDPDVAADNAAFNAFVAPYIALYSSDPLVGGGAVGGYSQIDDQDFFRESYEIGFDQTLYVGDTTHDLHFGYQWMEVAEDLARRSNGWGVINFGRDNDTDTNYIVARTQQQSLLSPTGEDLIPSIYSTAELQSFEINDTIVAGDWTYNIGVVISNDVYYGQGLAPEPSNPITGLIASPGTKYKMHEVDWSDMIQPRLGATWDYSDTGSVYFNYARYNPSASSLARAASWDRNLRSRIDVYFDETGAFVSSDTVDSSSGKWFQEGIKPRYMNEFLVGSVQELSDTLTVRAHVRHRESKRFWEDTGNAHRIAYPHPGEELPPGVPAELYVPNLGSTSEPGTIRYEIGSGSSYVIAELDGAYTRYWEAVAEANWVHDNWFVSGSYKWANYYGNFDQDNSTTDNDQAIFIGSSNIADGAGRQLWNLKKGKLSGDRRHLLKIYGSYQLPWEGQVGGYLVFQSGEPWEAWDRFVYSSQTSSSSDTIRFAETAGSRTTDSHWQLDLNYTHNFRIGDAQNLQLRLDLFNVFDNQTGYNINRDVNTATFGEPNSFYKPRRLQVAVKYQFN